MLLHLLASIDHKGKSPSSFDSETVEKSRMRSVMFGYNLAQQTVEAC